MTLLRRQWNNLLEALGNGSCIVFLGPLVSTVSEGGLPLDSAFAKALGVTLEEEGIAYDKMHSHNLTYIMQRFMTIKGVTSSDPGYEAKKFYEKYQGQINSIQKMVASLPISLIINTSPDSSIFLALKEQGKYRSVHDYYNFEGEESDDIEAPSPECPLVYNLFGFYKNTESLVLTEADQVKFISKVVKDQPSLPPKLLRQFQGKKTFLFLGFNWENWHLRLLLQSLDLKNDSNIMAHAGGENGLQIKTKDFYEGHFHFSFVTEEISDFLTELHNRFNASSEESVDQKKIIILSVQKDEIYRDELYKNLKPLPYDSWHSGLISLGEDSSESFNQHLESANIIFLLVSPDFMASNEILNSVWPQVLKQNQNKSSKVIPIITRTCNWQLWKELTQMPLILPKKEGEVGKAISSWERSDDAFQSILKDFDLFFK
ncbi:SIR2 family protein [Algoriphagus aquimarinus]|uniref:TIR domain-containing protein n=1 Tax=Algoriphagus aquimarinus TaxID=237018 RepID=A0A5C7AXR3_9BACT|nr:SIR2 family protein [Algoriphagus aquimarinus]TXE12359.1 TIR domain-containing protein [Algoriphagus aquimarinus]